MKDDKEVYEILAAQAPTDYRINELIRFSYPVRKVRINALVNKSPDESLVKVYNVLLRCIDKGFDDKTSLFDFLGIPQTDEFILRELFALREKGLLDFVSGKWRVTEDGKKFIEGNKIIRIEEREEYEFLMDGLTGEVFPILSLVVKGNKEDKYIDREFNVPIKSPDLLKDKYQELCDAYKQDSRGEAYLIDYDENDILFDKEYWIDYWFVEYIPKRGNREPYLEVKNINSLDKNDILTKKFNDEYWHYVLRFTDSDRKETEVIEDVEQIETNGTTPSIETNVPITDLTIWETKQKFIESLQNVKEQILIESPWIKRATLEYVPYFEEILKNNKKLIILYGIDSNAEHDYKTIKEIENLQQKYSKNFSLIDLSEHLKGSRFTGSHRKLLIKDNEYYISGSFNFLSFAKQEGERIANEESQLITIDVQKKWERVIKEYNLPIQPPTGREKNNSVATIDLPSNLNVKDINKTESNTNETWITSNKTNPKRAVIELSTKAVKLLVNLNHEIIDKGEFNFNECFFRKAKRTETGQCVDKNHYMIISEFKQKVLPSIKFFVNMAKHEYKVDVIHTVATAAYRTSENRDEVLSLIKAETGLNVEILSKKEESQATLWAYNFSAKNKELFRKSEHILMMDIGGGSSEITIFKEQSLQSSYSLEIGTTALKNRLLGSEISDIKDALHDNDMYVAQKVRKALKKIEFSIDYCVGVGRPITIATGKNKNEEQHDYELTKDDLLQVLTEKENELLHCHNMGEVLNKSDDDEFDKVLVTRIGLPIVIEIMDFYNINSLKVNGTGLFYGIFFKEYFGIQ